MRGEQASGREPMRGGLGIQLASGLLLLGGAIGIVAGVLNGAWPPLLGRDVSPWAGGLAVITMTLFGAAGVVLGWRVRRMDLRAAKVCIGLGVVLAAISIGCLLTLGRGWYELLFAVVFLADACASTRAIQGLHAARPDGAS